MKILHFDIESWEFVLRDMHLRRYVWNDHFVKKSDIFEMQKDDWCLKK